jgi:uncharacterized protein with HEPN domain
MTEKIRVILKAIEAIEAYSVSSHDESQERHATIPRSTMIGTRNIIVRGYDQVKLQIVWKILQLKQASWRLCGVATASQSLFRWK